MLWKEQVNSVVVVTVLYHSNKTETQKVQKCHRDGVGACLPMHNGLRFNVSKGTHKDYALGWVGVRLQVGESSLCPQGVQLRPAAKALCKGS